MKAKKILAVGAFERDNFGDLLFYILTKHYLKNDIVAASSIIFADMRSTLGEIVLPYAQLLKNERWDAVLTVGGEVGGVDIDAALHMSLTGDIRGLYWYGDPTLRATIKNYLTAPAEGLAYMPNLTQYRLNNNTPLILNSVGLSNAGSHQNLLEQTLKSVDQIVARDSDSYNLCKDVNVDKFRLAPDLVQSICLLFPLKKNASKKSRYITFQISRSLMEKWGVALVADTLTMMVEKLKTKIVLVAAGTAPLHDDVDKYRTLAMLVNSSCKNEKVIVSQERQPLKIVKLIADSQLWVGSSLHGRIIASAYGVPRVSLDVKKVSNYARQWDSQFPYGFEIKSAEETVSVCNDALTRLKYNEMKEISLGLAKQANDSMAALAKDL